MAKHVAPLVMRLTDEAAERVRASMDSAIRALQACPAVSSDIVSASLPDSQAVKVAHGLGRAPRIVLVSPPRGAASTGRIVESLVGDRTKYITLTATGHGATIAVDVEVK